MITKLNDFKKHKLNEAKHPEFISTMIDRMAQKLHNDDYKKDHPMNVDAEIDKTYKKGFRAGFALNSADITGVKPGLMDILEMGEEAGRKAREGSGLKNVPPMLIHHPMGNKRNIAFDKIVNKYFVPLKENFNKLSNVSEALSHIDLPTLDPEMPKFIKYLADNNIKSKHIAKEEWTYSGSKASLEKMIDKWFSQGVDKEDIDNLKKSISTKK
jgi:hypothetical protein